MYKILVGLLFIFIVATSTFAQINISGYNHIALSVKDIAVSAQFYEYIIGLRRIPVPDNLSEIRAWFKIAEGQELHLLAGRKKKVNHDKNGSHVSFSVPDANDVEAYLKLQSISYHRQERFDGVVQIFITDPDGYVLELNEAKE